MPAWVASIVCKAIPWAQNEISVSPSTVGCLRPCTKSTRCNSITGVGTSWSVTLEPSLLTLQLMPEQVPAQVRLQLSRMMR